jgi:hypothetical protein
MPDHFDDYPETCRIAHGKALQHQLQGIFRQHLDQIEARINAALLSKQPTADQQQTLKRYSGFLHVKETEPELSFSTFMLDQTYKKHHPA